MSHIKECNDYFLRSHNPDEVYNMIYDDMVNKNYNNHIICEKYIKLKHNNKVVSDNNRFDYFVFLCNKMALNITLFLFFLG